jgi:hypothetical protein
MLYIQINMLHATDCREILLEMARPANASKKYAFTWPAAQGGGTVHLHGAAVRAALAVLPDNWTSRFMCDSLGARRLLIEWSRGAHARGRLLLRACGAADLGDRAREALQYCADAGRGWRVTSMPDEAWAAVRQCFPAKKYCSITAITAQDAVARILQHGWRNYTPVEIEDEE